MASRRIPLVLDGDFETQEAHRQKTHIPGGWDLNFQMVAENPTWGARRKILTESLPVGGVTVVQLVFRVQTFAKGNCAMLRRCVDEILAKNTGATIVFESYRVSFGAF